jgi:hypothetical protein
MDSAAAAMTIATIAAPVSPVPLRLLAPERDWVAEMRDLINDRAAGSISAPVAAREIVEELLRNDPELLRNWLLIGAAGFIRDAINARNKSKRGRNRNIAGRNPEVRAAFRNAVDNEDIEEVKRVGEAINDRVVTDFLQESYVVPGGLQMKLGDMRREERMSVAYNYRTSAKEHALRAAFLLAIDKRAGNKKTSEIFTEEKLAKLWHSLSAGS